MKIDLYTHSDKEPNRVAGEAAGLSGKALEYFLFAGYEHRMTYWVDEATGAAQLMAIDGHEVRFIPERK